MRRLNASSIFAVSTMILIGGSIARADEFDKPIDGGSSVSRTEAGGTFVFKEKIDGKSKVSIRAPGGSISFPNRHQDPFGGGSKLDGGSKVLLEAKSIKFNAKIDDGSETMVLIILSKEGTLELLETNGGARVYWCKANDSDPPTGDQDRSK